MKSWFKLTITESAGSDGLFRRLCRDFQRTFIAAGAPAGMALFAQSEQEGDARDVYFSPGSFPHIDELVRQHGGHPCAAPVAEAVTMVYGVPGAERRVLSENNHHQTLKDSGEHAHAAR